MRLRHPALRPALGLALAAVLAGCYSSRPALVERERGPAPVVPDTAEAGPARVGLAATMDLPENPYGDTAAVALPEASDLPSLNTIDGQEDDYAEGGVDPADVSVTRYYYDDAGTYYYEDVEDDLRDGGLGVDDDYYYGGYYADYYRYADPSYFPSLYTYYRPYRVYNPYRQFGWYNTWNRRYGAFGYSPYFAYDFYSPYWYDPFFYGPGFHFAAGFGFGGGFGFYDPFFGYGPGFGYGYGPSFAYFPTAGYYGPGFYGRPRSADYYSYRDVRERRGSDDGVRSPVRGAPGTNTSPIVESTPNPARMPARRGLNPARIPRDPTPALTSAPERAGRAVLDPVDVPGRRDPAAVPRAPRRTDPGSPGRTSPVAAPTTTAPVRTAPGRTAPAPITEPSSRPARGWSSPERSPREVPRAPRRVEEPAPVREAAPRSEPRTAEPPRRAPRRVEEGRSDPLPEVRRPETRRPEVRSPRREPVRREARPAPPPRREQRSSPPPRRETRPAPPPQRQESRPAPRQQSRPASRPARQTRSAPAPRRQESQPARSSGSSRSTGGSSRPSRRGGNNGA